MLATDRHKPTQSDCRPPGRKTRSRRESVEIEERSIAGWEEQNIEIRQYDSRSGAGRAAQITKTARSNRAAFRATADRLHAPFPHSDCIERAVRDGRVRPGAPVSDEEPP